MKLMIVSSLLSQQHFVCVYHSCLETVWQNYFPKGINKASVNQKLDLLKNIPCILFVFLSFNQTVSD